MAAWWILAALYKIRVENNLGNSCRCHWGLCSPAENKPATKPGEYLSLFANPHVVLEYLPLCAIHTRTHACTHACTHTAGSALAFFPFTSKGQYMYNATQSSPVSHDPLPGIKMRKSLYFFSSEWICTSKPIFSWLLGQHCEVTGWLHSPTVVLFLTSPSKSKLA